MSVTGANCDALVLGLDPIYLDLVFNGLERVPRPGEELFAREFHMLPGGVFNVAACLARLGADVALAADVDQGLIGEFMLAELRRFGVRTDLIRRLAPGGTAITVSYSLGNERAFLSFSDQAQTRQDLVQVFQRARPRVTIAPNFAAQVRNPGIMEQMQRIAGLGRTLILTDACHSDVTLEHPQSSVALGLCDVFFCNQAECLSIAGTDDWEQGADKLLGRAKAVVVKLGEQGAAYLSSTRRLRESAPNVEVKDTTGAGDCFVAAYAFGLLQGWEPDKCLRAAVLQGSASVRGSGGTSTLFSREELLARL